MSQMITYALSHCLKAVLTSITLIASNISDIIFLEIPLLHSISNLESSNSNPIQLNAWHYAFAFVIFESLLIDELVIIIHKNNSLANFDHSHLCLTSSPQ